jgi:4-hydroxythreonine-4-phosphate dehydrogenase
MVCRPTIIITTGDPRGIGPEVTEKALKDPCVKRLANFIIIKSSDNTGFDAIEKAVEILKHKKADALVTAPVNKAKIAQSGIPFKGHTEYLAEATHTKRYAMMLCGGPLKVTTATRHVALKGVAKELTQDKIIDAIELTNEALKKYFRIKNPKIGVCGLNPHCGEGGKIGKEEISIIGPAVKKLKKKIPGLRGPISGDVIFYMAYKGKLDAVISMYHDQGLGPLKMVAFEKGVNITLGLPFVRTSPDHGTAYDIAGKGIADPTSMKEAIRLATKMCR